MLGIKAVAMSIYTFRSVKEWFPQYSVLSIWPHATASPAIKPQFTYNNPTDAPMEREISKITDPEIMVVPSTTPNGIGVLLIPGGSYKRVAFDKEGVDTAIKLSSKGYTVFVMTYRMPADGHKEGNRVSLADAQRAMRIIRSQSDSWGLKHLGVIGFSAGGHVTSSLATCFEMETYESVDELESISARPDFFSLMYPVITMDETIGHPGSRLQLLGCSPDEHALTAFSTETRVSPNTPPCFLVHASDDKAVKVENSIVFWQALKTHQVPTEIHLFENGGHGFGIRDTIGLPVEAWPQLFDIWVKRHFH